MYRQRGKMHNCRNCVIVRFFVTSVRNQMNFKIISYIMYSLVLNHSSCSLEIRTMIILWFSNCLRFSSFNLSMTTWCFSCSFFFLPEAYSICGHVMKTNIQILHMVRLSSQEKMLMHLSLHSAKLAK